MINKNEDPRETWFIDIDGTILKHNYSPEDEGEIFLQGMEEKLRELNATSIVVLITSRNLKHAEIAVNFIKSRGIKVDGIICNLPTGKRTIVNDFKSNDGVKAEAINLERNVGWLKT